MKKKFKKGFFAVINGEMVFIDENNKEDMKLWEDEQERRKKEVENASKNVCGA